MPRKPPAMQLYVKDAVADTSHLPPPVFKGYWNLVWKSWLGVERQEMGFLPASDTELRDLSGLTKQEWRWSRERILRLLGKEPAAGELCGRNPPPTTGELSRCDCNPQLPGCKPRRYFVQRIVDDLQRADSVSVARAEAGRKGAEARWQLPSDSHGKNLAKDGFAFATAVALDRGAEANASSTSVGNRAAPTPRPCHCGCGRSLAGRPGNTKWATPDCANKHAQRTAAAAAANHGAALQRIVAFYNKMTGRLTAAEAQGRPALQLLQLGVPEPTIKLAILGAMTDPFHLGFNDREQPYLDLVTILRRDRYEGHADRARQATFRNVKQDVLGFWASRWNKDKNSTMKRLFTARDVQLKQEGGQPFGAAAAFDGLPRGAAWPEEEHPS